MNATHINMVNELAAWALANGLPFVDAEELLCDASLTQAQRNWVGAYIERWDAAE